MTPARKAVGMVNDSRMLMPGWKLAAPSRVIAREALRDDPDALRFIWLLQWEPRQLIN